MNHPTVSPRQTPTMRALAVLLALCLLPLRSLAQTPPLQIRAAQRLRAPTTDELGALRPLAARGAVATVDYPDGGPNARVTVVVPVAAPLATVRRVLVEVGEWPAFMPALRAVDPLSRAGRMSAWRLSSTGPMLDVGATCAVNEVSPRRLDFSVDPSDFGPAGARWDLVAEDPTHTLMAVTSWSDPSQGHWLIRQAASSNPSATAGMNLAIDTSLALAVARRSLALAGTPVTARPSRMVASPQSLSPLPMGEWVALTRRVYVVAFTLAPDGALESITVAGQAGTTAARVLDRVTDVSGYPRHIPGVRAAREAVGSVPDAPRFHIALGGTWDRGEGTVSVSRDGDTSARFEGLDGELQGLRWRWDMGQDPGYSTVVQLTGVVDEDLSGLFTRVAVSREPYLLWGLTALRELVWLRYSLAGL